MNSKAVPRLYNRGRESILDDEFCEGLAFYGYN